MSTTFATLIDRLQNILGDYAGEYTSYYKECINAAARMVYPKLHRPLNDYTLITGNALPNAHFEDWGTDYPTMYSGTNVTCADTSTAGLHRGGAHSAKVTASAANGYMSISSDDYPSLLDLEGETEDLKCWAYPEVADDATVVIYTVQPDGTTQTLTSTTSTYAGRWNLIELEDQSINENIEHIEIRFNVATNAKYAYFDNARLIGAGTLQHLLPDDFHKGELTSVYLQSSGQHDDYCDDLNAMAQSYYRINFEPVVIKDGYSYLRFPNASGDERLLWLRGITPLESLSSATDTISINGGETDTLIYLAAYILWDREASLPNSQDRQRYRDTASLAYAKYQDAIRDFAAPIPQRKVRFS